MPYLEQEERKIYYEQQGQGELIILIHGLGLCSESWLDLPELLAKKFTVVTYDLRGHGKSFAPDTGYSYREQVNDLKALITELDHKRLHILSHSLGGAVAVKYALDQPDVVKSLILAAPHVVGYRDYQDWPNVYRTARNIDIDQAKIQWETFRLFSRVDRESDEWKAFTRCLKAFSGKPWTDPEAFKYLDESDMKLLDNLTMRTLVLCGREDVDFLPLAKLINARLTNGSLFEIPDCGHMIHYEKPEVFKREVGAFLQVELG